MQLGNQHRLHGASLSLQRKDCEQKGKPIAFQHDLSYLQRATKAGNWQHHQAHTVTLVSMPATVGLWEVKSNTHTPCGTLHTQTAPHTAEPQAGTRRGARRGGHEAGGTRRPPGQADGQRAHSITTRGGRRAPTRPSAAASRRRHTPFRRSDACVLGDGV